MDRMPRSYPEKRKCSILFKWHCRIFPKDRRRTTVTRRPTTSVARFLHVHFFFFYTFRRGDLKREKTSATGESDAYTNRCLFQTFYPGGFS
jgi:hypothetical protein